jgi:nitric oxide reductase subunit B
MEHGSLWGHGAYLGPDYSAEYLHRLGELTRDSIASEKYGKPFALLSTDEQSVASARTATVLKENRYDPASQTLRLVREVILSHQFSEWSEYFGGRKRLWPPDNYIQNPEIRALTAYFAWAAQQQQIAREGLLLQQLALRPSGIILPQHSIWSSRSLITLLSGLGLILFVVGKFDYLGWKDEGGTNHFMHSAPITLKLTPSQWATGAFFGIVALLFLAQASLGGVLAHYRAEPGGFYGFDIARILPYTLARTWHLQLAIFWIATAWVGGGLFLAAWVGGAEPKRQKAGVYALLGALVVVVLGSLAGGRSESTTSWVSSGSGSAIRVHTWILEDSGSFYWRFSCSGCLDVSGAEAWIEPCMRGLSSSYAAGNSVFTCPPFTAHTPTSPLSTTGASGSFIFGWKDSLNSSPRCWLPSCSIRWVWSAPRPRRA